MNNVRFNVWTVVNNTGELTSTSLSVNGAMIQGDLYLE